MAAAAPETVFLGREPELAEAETLLRSTRLLTIVGPGGQGKTRFAFELARRLPAGRYHEQAACLLAPLRDPTLVLPSLCQALSVREQPGLDALSALEARLEERSALALLDNLEHLPASWSALGELLERCPGLTLLATSREPLRLAAERLYPLPALPEDESVALLCERARLEPSEALRELAGRLEGLPLALELAAARLTLLTPAQLLERLSQRLDLLKAGRDADPRQQTLRATIEWSYDLLAEEEQRLFRALSVFAGGCTLEAAEEVAGADLDTLQSLVDKSLLRFSQERFWMLETLREFAAGELGSPEADDLRATCATYFLDLAERGNAALSGPDQKDWLERLGRELSNLWNALAILDERGDAVALARLAGALWRVWHRLGYLDEGRAWLERALAASSLPADIRARAQSGAGYLAKDQGDLDAARTHMQEALAIARAGNDRAAVANALNNLALVAHDAGDIVEAERLYLESLEIRREIGDLGRIAASLNNLGLIAVARGDHDLAESRLRECLSLFGEVGDARGVAVSLGNLSDLAYQRGDPRAFELGRESLQAFAELGERTGIQACMSSLSRIAARRGQLERSARLAAAAERLSESTGMALEPDDGAIASARESLGEEMWTRGWEAGRSLELDDAVAYALEDATDA